MTMALRFQHIVLASCRTRTCGCTCRPYRRTPFAWCPQQSKAEQSWYLVHQVNAAFLVNEELTFFPRLLQVEYVEGLEEDDSDIEEAGEWGGSYWGAPEAGRGREDSDGDSDGEGDGGKVWWYQSPRVFFFCFPRLCFSVSVMLV